MKRHINAIIAGTAALLIIAAPASSKDKVVKSKATVSESWDAKEKRRQAELRAEANAPGPTRAEYARVCAVLAARKARENREIARYEQYKMEQKIALAEASAGRTYVVINGDLPTNAMPTRLSAAASGSDLRLVGQSQQRKANQSSGSRTTEILPPIGEGPSHPDRFARRRVQEEALDRQDAALDAQARSDVEALLQTVPFGVPVPGRPGYMSSPAPRFQGYIDVRDQSTGAVVMDPFTGEKVRVP